MPRIAVLATHLPVWGLPDHRVAGADQDAVTLAVDAGRAALSATDESVASIARIILVTRDLPTLSGGHEAVLLAGLDLPAATECTTVWGGAPAALSVVTEAVPGSLIIAVDVVPDAAAAAAVIGMKGLEITATARVQRSLPIRVRSTAGRVFDYDDPRLLRERGTRAATEALGLEAKPVGIAGLGAREASVMTGTKSTSLPTTGAAAPLFALVDVVARGAQGPLVAYEQASASAANIGSGAPELVVHAPAPLPVSLRKPAAEADIKISLSAYERAFDSRVGLRAGRCPECGQLDLPPRFRCLECGHEGASALVPLPREATVYTYVSVHVAVPGIATPYGLVVVDLGDTGVRLLAPVTDQGPAQVAIGDPGTVVLRRLSTRNGIPDYGYAFVLADRPVAHQIPSAEEISA
ncbi:MAG: DNA-binding protein [Mycobacterium sp.]|nr:DNA-binding protein [Mycobacterium sp.]